MHIEDFLTKRLTDEDDEILHYVQLALSYFYYVPAITQMCIVRTQMKYMPLFCTVNGVRYKVTGVSSMGDLFLHTDINIEMGYKIRVDFDVCQAWAKTYD